MKIGNPPGAQFEILVDGKPRSHRDIKAVAIETAEFLRSKNPNSDIAFVVIFHRAMAAARQGSASIDSWDLRRVLHRTFEHARTGR
jgi:hypothetical protein